MCGHICGIKLMWIRISFNPFSTRWCIYAYVYHCQLCLSVGTIDTVGRSVGKVGRSVGRSVDRIGQSKSLDWSVSQTVRQLACEPWGPPIRNGQLIIDTYAINAPNYGSMIDNALGMQTEKSASRGLPRDFFSDLLYMKFVRFFILLEYQVCRLRWLKNLTLRLGRAAEVRSSFMAEFDTCRRPFWVSTWNSTGWWKRRWRREEIFSTSHLISHIHYQSCYLSTGESFESFR